MHAKMQGHFAWAADNVACVSTDFDMIEDGIEMATNLPFRFLHVLF